MGYPGKATDDIMEKVQALRDASIRFGSTQSDARQIAFANIMEKLMSEIRSLVDELDDSCERYAADIRR